MAAFEKDRSRQMSSSYQIADTARILEEQECKTLKSYALKAKERREALKDKFRENVPASQLEYRTAYHRDRDRIIWSKAFKRLQHKTQVFPHYFEDHYKRRLTHSLEVAQIATTVARALKLNEVATEAIALGHDLGHTPFGHAGEQALNKILNLKFKNKNRNIHELQKTIKNELKNNGFNNKNKLPVPIFGFDHCIHAIEVVSRIAKEYGDETQYGGGLNLTLDVRDGILKHICERTRKDDKRDKPLSNIPALMKYNTFKIFGTHNGSLEAQCVYFADKVTYLLGDIEDGIRSDVLQCQELNKHPFIPKYLSKYYRKYRSSKLDALSKVNFPSFRSKVLTTLILNCINNAEKNIRRSKIRTVDDVLSYKKRIVFLSDDLKNSWKDFYSEWMVNNLFKNKNVVACSFKAEKIVVDLFNAYFVEPNLINSRYYEHCENSYRKTGVSNKALLKLIIVRNYIAGMTDAFASNQHARLFMPLEHIRF
jgi:dGTPase